MAKLTLPSAMLSTAAASVAEGAGAINLTVTLSTVQTYTATVSYITSDGTATAGSDYTAASGTLTFAPGITSQVIAVPIIDDSSDEPNETFTVALNSPSNAILGTPSSTTVTITDDDSAPTLSWQAGNFNAGEAAGSGLATVLLSAASSFTVTVNYASSDGSATLTPPPPDYTAKSGTLTFAPSQTSQSVSITILDDTLAESNETINLTLSSPTNATLGTASATMTIVDDDGGAQPSEEFYTYDAIGNLLSKTGVGTYTNGANGNGTGAGPHRIKQINGGAAFVYDPNGNLSNGGGASYTWDYENRPLTIATSSGSESYAYDADGERVKVVAGSTTTVYLGGLWEETSAGATKAYYTVGGQVVAVRDSSDPDPLSYLHGDHLGSVSVASGASASNKGSQRFDPWGKLITSALSQTRKNYTGQYLDTTGLLYYHARYYDPTIARFLSADSVVPGSASGGMDGVALKGLTVDFHEPGFVSKVSSENGFGFWFQLSDDDKQQLGDLWGPQNPRALNRYSYVQNNPVRWTDPSGHCLPWCAIVIAGAAAAAYLYAGGAVAVHQAGVAAQQGTPQISLPSPEELADATIGKTARTLFTAAAQTLGTVLESRYKGDPRSAGEIINKEKQGRIKSQFPAEYKNKTPDQIYKDAKAGVKKAQTAKKLLDSGEYDKDAKR